MKAKLPVEDGIQREFWSTRSASQADKWPRRGIIARYLYTGRHHQSVMASIDRLRSEFCHMRIKAVIVSAGYGLVEEWDRIGHYDESFDNMSRQESIDAARRLGIRDQLEMQLDEYKYAVFLLSEKYLNAIEAPLGIADHEIYFAGKALKSDSKDISITPAGREEARSMGVAPRMAKAEMFRRFTESALNDGLIATLEGLVEQQLTGPSPE